MKVLLSDISEIQFGFYAKPDTEGDVKYLQAKHFDDLGQLSNEIDTFLMRNEKKLSHLLIDGDILFVGKGFRNFAWTYTSEIGDAIASSIFFVIRPNKEMVNPEFLTTLFNTSKYQTYFQQLGAGSSITSIRKSELEAIKIDLPELALQNKIVELKKLHQRDIQLSKELIEQKEKKFQTIFNDLQNNMI
ncbi:MAG: restriction endonuclease subunit S [Bacteroidales bacterium]|nr:restriction endonuclease subunit S [Bacteroidales bacterium]